MNSNTELINYLKTGGYITSKRVEEAFRQVDRSKFVPEKHKESPYKDLPLSIAENATISAPHMVAVNTELLEVKPGNTVLEIGSGSGYQAAVLGELAEKVVGIEVNPELVEESRKRLQETENVEIIEGSDLKPVKTVFERILYSVATESIEKSKQYLKEDGVIVAPIKQNGYQTLTSYRDGETSEHGRVRFVEMV